jgi:hypothetical protein
MGVVFHVEREPDDPRRLAADMAEAIQTAEDHQVDANAFAAASKAERDKALERRAMIKRVEEHRSSGAPVRRMDPMAEYDLNVMAAERDAFFARADEFRKIADGHLQDVERAKIKAKELQQRIKRARS